MDTYNGEPVADPAKLIRLTLRGHYVRWRLDNALAGSCPIPGASEGATRGRPRRTGAD